MNLSLLRSSDRIIRTASSIALKNVGSDKHTPAPSSYSGSKRHRLVSQTFELKAAVTVPEGKQVLRCVEQKRSYRPNISNILSAGNLSNSLSCNTWFTEDVTENRGPIDSSDSDIRGMINGLR